MANLEPTMFREYDVRGLVNDQQINPHSVSIIAKAYATMLLQNDIHRVVVGHDLRTGSKELTEVAVEAMLTTGIEVVFLGQILTPMMYAAQYYYETKGGMMVTASHNPNGWLGFKLALGYSYTFSPKDIKELKALTVSEKFATGKGTRLDESKNIMPRYTQDLVSRVKIQKPVRVLINTGNGTAGEIVPPILRAAGVDVVEFLTEPDLEFKHYFPNPADENMMKDTAEQTVKNHCDLGIAIDGDGDRLGTTDEKGNIVWADRYLILLSREVLKATPGANIIFDIKSTRALPENIKKYGGTPVMWKTGHSYIKEKLHQANAPLGGELSGHIFFGAPLYYGFDDATFTALQMIEMLSKTDKTFSQLDAEIPGYVSTPALQAHCDDTLKYDIVAKLVDTFKKEGYNVVTFEDLTLGGRVEFENGWGLVRASSNLPVLVFRFEATTEQGLDEIIKLFKERLSQYPEISDKWESG